MSYDFRTTLRGPSNGTMEFDSSIFSSTVTLKAPLTVQSTAQFDQAVTMNGTLTANAPVNVNAALTAGSTAHFNSVAQFNDTLKCGVVNSTSDTITLAATKVRLNADVEIAGKLTFLANTARSITVHNDGGDASTLDIPSENNAGVEIFCQSRDDMKFADTSMPLYFDGDIWLPESAGDLEDTIAVDTLEGCFVQSVVDPSCVWVRNVSVYVPEHFGAEQSTLDCSQSIQVGIDVAYASRKAFHFPGNVYGLSSQVRVPAGACITSSSRAMLVSMIGNDDALLVSDAGDGSDAPVSIALPSFKGFRGTAVSVQNADLVTLSANSIIECGTAVEFQNSRNGVAEVHRIRDCDTAVIFASESSGSGLTCRCISGATTCVLCSGDADLGGQFLEAHRVEIVRGGGAFLDNARSTPVTHFRAIVTSRCAGDGFSAAAPTQIVAGVFVNARLEFNGIVPLDESHLAIEQLQRSSVWLQTGIELPRYSASTNSDLSNFNTGKHVGALGFLLACTFPATTEAGSLQSFYAWNMFADSSVCAWTADIVGGDALGCMVTQIVDEASPADGGRLKIVIWNVAPVEEGSTALVRIRRLM